MTGLCLLDMVQFSSCTLPMPVFGPQKPTKRICLIIKYSATHFATVYKFGKVVYWEPPETDNTLLQKITFL